MLPVQVSKGQALLNLIITPMTKRLVQQTAIQAHNSRCEVRGTDITFKGLTDYAAWADVAMIDVIQRAITNVNHHIRQVAQG